ncbi:MAG: EAL domain-containing protein [Oscillospiraceae bacterium]|nr:EAL domain-containing protein [Oscillospiraceae bacterium]
MTRLELWDLITGGGEDESLLDVLERGAYDERVTINLREDTYSFTHNTVHKYALARKQGAFSLLYEYCGENLVYSEDKPLFLKLFDPATLERRLKEAEPKGALAGSLRFRRQDATWLWTRLILVSGPEFGLEDGIIYGYLYDIERQKLRVEGAEAMGKAAPRVEELTGLPDSMDFFRPAQRLLSRLGAGWCILHIEIEKYKLFVDWYGLESGQYLISRIGGILRREAEETGGIPGYMGQEKFALITVYDRERIEALYAELKTLISSVSTIDGFAPLFGIALIDGSSHQVMEYYNNAALSAEEIRQDLHEHIQLYDPALHKRNAEEYRILREFQRALNSGAIEFWLQPQYRISNGKIVGAESLARWRKPGGGYISPAVFVPILEKYNLVTRLDKFIWESVCVWLRGWIDRGRRPVPVSVNISQVDILQEDIPGFIDGLAKKYELPTSCIKVEITESAYVEDSNAVKNAVRRFRELGYMVLMDDFGSGYSSLNMLSSLNVDVIKLDAQFLRIRPEEIHKGVSILESIVSMAKSLSTPIVVEGVETDTQRQYLADLGCQYIQGGIYHMPMPVADFEELCSDDARIDEQGIDFKANEQLHAREFLDENLYSDAMLNNILGPVAFYCWHGEDVDIIRYNEQFYRMVGIANDEMAERRFAIQKVLYPEDREGLYSMLSFAEEHRIVGAKGILRTYKPSGALVWISVQIYYIREDEEGKKYYVSAEDVTELQYLSSDLPGAYYRCANDEKFSILFLSQSFLHMVGYTSAEISGLYDNKLLNMVHPRDRELLVKQTAEVVEGKIERPTPYRLRKKQGDYVYVAEQAHLTDRFGSVCWQGIAIDVTEMMNLRNQMNALSDYLTDSVLFLYRRGARLEYEVAIHGLHKRLGLDAEQFQNALNDGSFCRRIVGARDLPHEEYTELFVTSCRDGERTLEIEMPDGGRIKLRVRVDRVDDQSSSLDYIVILHEAE